MTNLTIHNIPDEIIKELIETYPDQQEREAIVNAELIDALIKLTKEHKKKKFFEILDNFTPFPEQNKSSVEMVREIRETEVNNH